MKIDEHDTPSDDPAEDVPLATAELDRAGGDRQVLRRDHLAEHPTGRVRRGKQGRRQMRLHARGDL